MGPPLDLTWRPHWSDRLPRIGSGVVSLPRGEGAAIITPTHSVQHGHEAGNGMDVRLEKVNCAEVLGGRELRVQLAARLLNQAFMDALGLAKFSVLDVLLHEAGPRAG